MDELDKVIFDAIEKKKKEGHPLTKQEEDFYEFYNSLMQNEEQEIKTNKQV